MKPSWDLFLSFFFFFYAWDLPQLQLELEQRYDSALPSEEELLSHWGCSLRVTLPLAKCQIAEQRTVMTVHHVSANDGSLGRPYNTPCLVLQLVTGSLGVSFAFLGSSYAGLEFSNFIKLIGLQIKTLLTCKYSSKWSYSRSFHFFLAAKWN